MIFTAQSRLCLLGLLALALAVPPAPALLNIDGTRSQIFVFGSVTLGHSSNIFSDATERGDYSTTVQAGIELRRRAGIIAVNSTFKIDYTRYQRYSGEDAFNPYFSIEFDKTNGRMTGSLSVNAYRESRSDSAVNLRTDAWNFPVALSLKYPINEKLYVTSQTSYLERRYRSSAVLANYTDYTEGLDFYYVYTSKLDLVGGYRIRLSQTSLGGDTYDHWFNIGATGALLAKLNGSVRLGYQIRALGSGGARYNQVNALASLSWPVTRKLALNGQVSRDFNTIATGASVDSSSVALNATYSFTRKLDFSSGLSYGRNTFLNTAPPTRHDHFFGYDLGARYRMNEHLQLGASYVYFRNHSSLSFSDFARQGVSFDISSRY